MRKSKLRRRLRRLLYPSFGRRVAVYAIDGLSLLLRAQSRIDRRVIENGTWEPDEVTRLIELTRKARQGVDEPVVFLDIGAYFGYYALRMHRERMFERIVAFEPDAMNFAQLGAQIYLNDAAYEIEARNVAVSDRAGHAEMPKSVIRKNRGTSGLGIVAAPEDMVPVETVTLDAEYDFRDQLLVAKIDVEGHQAEVLNGMRNLIARNRTILQIEMWDNERAGTLPAMASLGLKVIGNMYPDFFATNIDGLAPELDAAAMEARASEIFDGVVPTNGNE